MSIFRPIFILAIVAAFTTSLVFAQKTSTKRKAQSQAAPSSSPTQMRSRRTAKPSASEAVPNGETTKTDSNAPAAQPSPVASTSPAESPNGPQLNTTQKPAEKTPETQPPATTETLPAAPTDPILALRDQIDTAATPQERIRLQLQLAEQLSNNGHKADAVAELHAVTGLDVFDPQGFYNAGNALARLGDTDEAVVAYRKAIEQRKGKYSRAFNNLGVVLLRVGRWDEAHDAFLSALKVENFRYAEASYNLGRLYSARGQMDLAIRQWRRAVTIDRDHKAAAQSLARSRNEDQITMEQPAAVAAPDTSNRTGSSTTTPIVAEKPARSSSSPRSTTKPLSLDVASFGFLQKARTASERGNKLEAIENYQRLISRQNGYFGPANLELSFLLISLKRNEEALATLLPVANREGSRYPISYYHLARFYEAKGDLKLAAEWFMRTVAAHGNQNAQFLLDLSRVREKQGDFKGALDAVEQYIALVKKDGQEVSWSEDRLTALRQKAALPK